MRGEPFGKFISKRTTIIHPKNSVFFLEFWYIVAMVAKLHDFNFYSRSLSIYSTRPKYSEILRILLDTEVTGQCESLLCNDFFSNGYNSIFVYQCILELLLLLMLPDSKPSTT